MSFYVYQLVDPRDGKPFYVGKGTGDRAWSHQRQVERSLGASNPRKVDRIRQILMAGFDVEVEIIQDYKSEADALQHEWRLVDAMPTLLNIMPGGGGRCRTTEEIEQQRRDRRAQIAAIRAREAGIKIAINVERKRRDFVAQARSQSESEAISGWVGENRQALSGQSAYLSAPSPARPFTEREKCIGLTEAKAHFEATGEFPHNLLRGTKQRLAKWVKKRQVAT